MRVTLHAGIKGGSFPSPDSPQESGRSDCLLCNLLAGTDAGQGASPRLRRTGGKQRGERAAVGKSGDVEVEHPARTDEVLPRSL
jgi:hypothetical protein